MKIKNDDALPFLRSFGFTCEEKTPEGFLRYQKTIGGMMVTIANGQFENKIRISLLQNKEGMLRVSYKDVVEYSEMLGRMMEAGLLSEGIDLPVTLEADINEMDNPLIGFPQKPSGFMAL